MIEVGQKFGRVAIVEFVGRDAHFRKLWRVSCECGSRQPWIAREDGITRGRVTSCGCLRAEKFVTRNTKHGLTSRKGNPPEFGIWAGMLQRCENPKAKVYKDYGARGIKVCAEWHSFEAFLRDMGPRPSPEHSVERSDNSKGYEPGNCVWATHQTQMQNTRHNVYVEFGGERVCVSEAARRAGVDKNRIFGRVRDRGVTHQQALDSLLA